MPNQILHNFYLGKMFSFHHRKSKGFQKIARLNVSITTKSSGNESLGNITKRLNPKNHNHNTNDMKSPTDMRVL
jgi:hypothetical protein